MTFCSGNIYIVLTIVLFVFQQSLQNTIFCFCETECKIYFIPLSSQIEDFYSKHKLPVYAKETFVHAKWRMKCVISYFVFNSDVVFDETNHIVQLLHRNKRFLSVKSL